MSMCLFCFSAYVFADEHFSLFLTVWGTRSRRSSLMACNSTNLSKRVEQTGRGVAATIPKPESTVLLGEADGKWTGDRMAYLQKPGWGLEARGKTKPPETQCQADEIACKLKPNKPLAENLVRGSPRKRKGQGRL